MEKTNNLHQTRAVTLMELLVVVLIISILATAATGVYSNQARRAKIAAAKDLVRQIEIGVTRYQVDTGTLPPSGSNTTTANDLLSSGTRVRGSGYLHVALMYGMKGTNDQLAPTWRGPYINIQADQLGVRDVNLKNYLYMHDILDPWGNYYIYVNSQDYQDQNANFWGGTNTFKAGTVAGDVNPNLPNPNPFPGIFYNMNTYQVISFGPNGKSLNGLTLPGSGMVPNYAGTESDDITNFGY